MKNFEVLIFEIPKYFKNMLTNDDIILFIKLAKEYGDDNNFFNRGFNSGLSDICIPFHKISNKMNIRDLELYDYLDYFNYEYDLSYVDSFKVLGSNVILKKDYTKGVNVL